MSLLAIAALSQAGSAWADHQVVDRVSSGPLGGNTGAEPNSFTISRDGSRSIFTTAERLVVDDTDDQSDVYQRAGGSTTLLSIGPVGGNGSFPARFPLVSEDGSRVLFQTAERLTADDTDARFDLYIRAAGATTLVSTGPAGGNGDFDVIDFRVLMSADGATVAFQTQEALTGADTDSLVDIYLRAGRETTRIAGDGLFGLSRDGQRVFFSTIRHLTSDDTDGPFSDDIYKWEAGTTTLQSVGSNGQNSDRTNIDGQIDADGRHLVFTSYGQLVPEDTDDVPDVYERVGDTITRVGPGDLPEISADGSHVFFQTTERLVAADTDSYGDIYVRVGNTLELVSAGPLAVDQDFLLPQFTMASADGNRVFFFTYERLTPEDTDGTGSAYEYSGGASARWLAPGGVAGISDDGSRVFILTDEPLLPSDTDTGCNDADIVGCEDVYEIAGGQTTLISTGPGDPSSGDAGVCVNRSSVRIVVDCSLAVSADGRQVLFWHDAPLLAGDTDSSFDIYLASAGPVRSNYRNAQQFCRAERSFLGTAAFRERYGSAGKHKNAFRNCVQANRR